MKRFHINPKLKLGSIIYFTTFLTIGFYIEIIYPGINTMNWTKFPVSVESELPLRILLVADPQLLGEIDEMKYIGAFSRWDSDRYLHVHYQAAFNFISPQIVIFLGDIFDEGTKANLEQRKRYYHRFRNVFSIQRNHQVKHIFIPGDNDIGGEKEPVYLDKVSYFNETFGDIQKPYVYKENEYDLQFIKLSGVYSKKNMNNIRDLETPEFRFVLTHDSCLQSLREPCLSVLKGFNPSLILSGHSHLSTYYRITAAALGNEGPEYFKHFLLPYIKPELPHTEHSQTIESKLRVDLQRTRLNLREIIHEITVPTCSYRMGVPDMGYGAMQLYKNGTMDYTVLWLPSRFNQLYIYLAFYIISKLIVYPWITWKLIGFLWRCLIKTKTNFKRRRNSVTKYLKV